MFLLCTCSILLRCETFLRYWFSSHDIRIPRYCPLRLHENCDYINGPKIASEFLSLVVVSQPTFRRSSFGQLCFSLPRFLWIPHPIPKIHFFPFLFLVLALPNCQFILSGKLQVLPFTSYSFSKLIRVLIIKVAHKMFCKGFRSEF